MGFSIVRSLTPLFILIGLKTPNAWIVYTRFRDGLSSPPLLNCSSPHLLISLLATPLHIQGFQRVSSDVDSPLCGRTVTFGEYKLVWSHSGASLLLIRSSSSSSSQALRSPFGNYSRSAHIFKLFGDDRRHDGERHFRRRRSPLHDVSGDDGFRRE